VFKTLLDNAILRSNISSATDLILLLVQETYAPGEDVNIYPLLNKANERGIEQIKLSESYQETTLNLKQTGGMANYND
jgi:hypothetical protein